ncbi:hypothetical protein ACYZT3_11800 [Pseudomonas sp. MDT1-16]|nr:hypothetical protein [Pseudomonas sp. AL03]
MSKALQGVHGSEQRDDVLVQQDRHPRLDHFVLKGPLDQHLGELI